MKSIMKFWIIVLVVAAIVIPQASFAKRGKNNRAKKHSEHISVNLHKKKKHNAKASHLAKKSKKSRKVASVEGKKHKSKKSRYAKLPPKRYRK